MTESSDSSVEQVWSAFLEVLARKDSRFTAALNPSLPEKEIVSRLERFGFAIPDDLVGLYRIGNGERQDHYLGIFFGNVFLDIDSIMHIKTKWRDSLVGDEDDEMMPQSYHLPIFSDMCGNYLALDLRKSPAAVYEVGADYNEPEYRFGELVKMLRAALEVIHSPDITFVSGESTAIISLHIRSAEAETVASALRRISTEDF